MILLGSAAVGLLLSCAALIVLGTVLGATLTLRSRATEQAVVQATSEASSAEMPGVPAATSAAETQQDEVTNPSLPTATITSTIEVSAPAKPTSTLTLTQTAGLTTTAPSAPPPEAAGALTTTEAAATNFTIDPLDVPAPEQALELTPTAQLTLSSVIFVENVGQFRPDVRFQVRGATGGSIWLAPDAIWLMLLESGGAEGAGQTPQGVHLKFSFVGANPTPEIEPFDQLDTQVSYFRGQDPAQWRTGVPVWRGVRYKDLYPGVDLELTSEGETYVQRLVVQPGADLSPVQLRVDGAESLALVPLPVESQEGDNRDSMREPDLAASAAQLGSGSSYLRLATALGEFSLPLLEVTSADSSPLPAVAPPSIEVVDGSSVVHAPFFARSAEKAQPDGRRILPPGSAPVDDAIQLLYSAFLARGGSDTSRAIAVDPAGSAYVAGDSFLPSLPAAPGPFDPAAGGSYDVAVVQVNAEGTELASVTFLGGSGDERAYGIAVDGTGNTYLTGRTNSTDLPVTADAFESTYSGGYDAFVAKIQAQGAALAYATFLGGDGDDWAQAIAVDGEGGAYVTGATQSADFPATTGALDVEYGGERDAFVSKVNGAGTGLAFSTFLGGSGADEGAAIAVDAAGNAYITGATQSADLKTTGALDPTYHGAQDAFLVKMNGSGTELAYATFLGGADADRGAAIAVDSGGNAYVAGATRSLDFPTTPWAFDTSHAGGSDAFVAKVDPAGAALTYAALLGGSGDESALAVAVDQAGYVYVAGSAQPFELPPTVGAFDASHNGGLDAFVARVGKLGTALEYATFVGGAGQDEGLALAIDALGSAYLAGSSDSAYFASSAARWRPTARGYVPTVPANVANSFVSKLSVGTPFLDLPVAYTNFAQAAMGNVGDRGPGRVNSWFDHSYPNHSKNKNLTRWDGTVAHLSASAPSRIGESWYDGHGGIDFRRQGWNEPIFAAAPGKVIDTVTSCKAGNISCGNYFGNRVWIDHGNGYATVYAHLKTVQVSKGTVITDPNAQPLGIMGNTGRSLGTHLHFGVYYDWNGDGQWTSKESVDPFGWLGNKRDPWDAPDRYLWKYPLWTQEVAGLTASQASSMVLASPSGQVTAAIPGGSLDASLTMEVWDVPPASDPLRGWYATGRAFLLRAEAQGSVQAAAPRATVSMAYAAKDLVHLDPERLTLYRWDGEAWESLPTSVDRASQRVTAETSELGRFELHAPLLCPSDSLEPDDDSGAAQAVGVNGPTVERLFDIAQDVDWFRVEAEEGEIYVARTENLAPGVSTQLQVYDTESSEPLASSQAAGTAGASVQWKAPLDGTYLIRVSQGEQSAHGCNASYSFGIQQLPAPDRVAIAGPEEGILGSSYVFTATVSPSSAAVPITYVWQIDDGPPVTHTASLSDTLTPAWTKSGAHTIAVTVQNVAGTADGSHTFTLYGPPSAAFSASPTSGQAPLEVSFSNTSSGDFTTSLWDFGDGASSKTKNPDHSYQAAGVYTVTLTVSGRGGKDTATRAEYISVTPAFTPKQMGYRVFLPNIVRQR